MELGEGAWLCPAAFAAASSAVMESLLHVAGMRLALSWSCQRLFSSNALFPPITRVTFDDLVILFEQNLTIFAHLASTLYLLPNWQHLGIF